MFNLYLNRLNAEAKEALENIRAARAAGDIKLALHWSNWYWLVDQERKTMRQMSAADFVSYYFNVIVPAQA